MNNILSAIRLLFAHPIARRAPVRTVSNIIRWQTVSRRSAESIVVPWIGGTKLIVRRGMRGATGNLYYGLHEFAEMGFLLHLLRPDDGFLDIGANVGTYTLLGSGVCRARTLAFEPGRQAYKDLSANVAINGLEAMVRIEHVALGERDGETAFTKGLDTMNRVAAANELDTRIVEMRRLDGFETPTPLRLIKMDVEGGEGAVVRGGDLAFAAPSLLAVISETEEPEIVKRLEANGLSRRFYDPFERRLSDTPVHESNNHLFVRLGDEVEHRLANAPRFDVMTVQI